MRSWTRLTGLIAFGITATMFATPSAHACGGSYVQPYGYDADVSRVTISDGSTTIGVSAWSGAGAWTYLWHVGKPRADSWVRVEISGRNTVSGPAVVLGDPAGEITRIAANFVADGRTVNVDVSLRAKGEPRVYPGIVFVDPFCADFYHYQTVVERAAAGVGSMSVSGEADITDAPIDDALDHTSHRVRPSPALSALPRLSDAKVGQLTLFRPF